MTILFLLLATTIPNTPNWNNDAASERECHRNLKVGFPYSIDKYELSVCNDLRNSIKASICSYSYESKDRVTVMIYDKDMFSGDTVDKTAMLLTIGLASTNPGASDGEDQIKGDGIEFAMKFHDGTSVARMAYREID